MNIARATPFLVCLLAVGTRFQEQGDPPPISSRILRTDAGERILLQEVLVQAPVSAVWAAYTTDVGWTAWASPVARIDLRNGGEILTHYSPGAAIGDAGTNRLRIVNYVPERVLTLQADLQPNWPEVMKEDAEHLMNVVLFEAADEDRTRIRSYGVGYGDSPAYDGLLEFFAPANEGLFEKLKTYLEQGRRVDFEGK